MSLLDVRDLHFSYRGAERPTPILRGLDLTVEAGEMLAIQGSSGSGKSTLLYILGAMLHPEKGSIQLDGVELGLLADADLAELRNRKIGFVFQQFHLLPRATVIENILLPARYPCETSAIRPQDRERARELARRLGIEEHLERFPNQLSGGQQQRVAVARALLRNPRFILADEPTGNLDSESARQTMELFRELNREGHTILVITHDPEIARQCPRVIRMRDGRFEGEGSTAVPGYPKAAQPSPSRRPANLPIWVWSRALLPLAWSNLRRNRARSLLTMLGVTIGIASVLAMVTLGRFTQERILETYEALGVNKLSIHGWPNWELRATDKLAVMFRSFNLTHDLEPLGRLFPDVQRFSPVLQSWNNTASFAGITVSSNVRILGVGHDYPEITRHQLLLGRHLTPHHSDSRSAVCTIGFEIAKKLFRTGDPIGQIIYLTSGNPQTYACKVMGVYKSQSSNSEWNQPNLQILIPYTSFGSVSPDDWDSKIREAVLQVRPGGDVEATAKGIKAYFESKYGKSGRFSIDSDAVMLSQMKRFLRLFTLLLAGISAISLLVGGIGITNMMLVSVTERIKEIGLRRALGATGRSIRAQLLMESFVLCAAAGFAGLFVGVVAYEGAIFAATKFVSKLKFEWVLDPWAATVSVASILLVGVASGFVPALRAEKLEVVEALRSE